jgi:hypothetical protein
MAENRQVEVRNGASSVQLNAGRRSAATGNYSSGQQSRAGRIIVVPPSTNGTRATGR